MAELGLSAATGDVALVVALNKAIQAAIDHIKRDNGVVRGWEDRPLEGYRHMLEALLLRSQPINDPGLQLRLTALEAAMKQHLHDLEAFSAVEEATSSKPLFVRIGHAAKEACSQTRQEAIAALQAQDANLTKSIDEVAKLVSEIELPAHELTTKQAEVVNELEKQYSAVTPIIDDLRKKKELLGDSFAVLMFRDAEMAALAAKYQMALSVFWKQVQVMFRTEGALSEEAFFRGSWLHRAKAIRRLGEPLDIANWYFKNKHITNAEDSRPCHYVNGLFVSEYIYKSGLQAAAGRLGAALGQLLQQAATPRSDSMRGVEELRSAVEGVGLRGAVAAVSAALGALNDARRSKGPGHAAAGGLSKSEAAALERKSEEDLAAKLGFLRACTGRLRERAAEALALMGKVQGEAQAEPQASVWNHFPAAPGPAVPGGEEGERSHCAAAGWAELAKWVCWRGEELRAAVAAVDEAAQALEAAVAAKQQAVAVLVAAAEAAHAKLAAAAGDGVERVGIRDNHCRPGRYQLIQKQEVRCSGEFGEPPSSITLARKLQWLGSGRAATRFQADQWPDCIASLLLRPEAE